MYFHKEGVIFQKKIVYFLLFLFLISLTVGGCYLKSNSGKIKEPSTATIHTITGSIEKTQEGMILLKTKEGDLSLPITDDEANKYVSGEKILVYYSGVILETYPSQFETIIKIEKVK
ncbi:hypothetical protein Hs30E_19940 [Lactococcus hodotermopsidis]|uniref:DUF3221 domain-containing protein n=1 Tax=Pseudolactococcus hodotermopsidis TaxID=2709157 RepID=A0A6A0BFG2_9LACT|nr:hypothetical protein [Lactococcus hodotermopsidis]GFH43443.1 hypothetical protein Hs30E_19940 [Lactococcus hodotermopsidis]